MKTVVTQFLEQAAKHPKNPAVLDIRGTYTYEQMNNRSAYLAERIMEQLGGKGQKGRIALFIRILRIPRRSSKPPSTRCASSIPTASWWPAWSYTPSAA